MAVPQIRMDAIQWVVLALEICLLHVRGAQKPPVERVGPAVVGTLNAAFKVAFGGGTDARTAMAANVEEGLNASASIACDDDALAGDFTQNVVAGAWNFHLAPGIHPDLRIETLHLLVENLRVGVVAPRKRRRRGGYCLHGCPEVCVLSSILCHTKKRV